METSAMVLRVVLGALAALAAGAVQAQDTPGRFRLWVEAGPARQTRNDVQIPNDASGTRFSIADAVGSGPFGSVRVDFSWALNDRQDLRFLVAPLGYEASAALPGDVSFNGASFSGARPATITYRFDSYRATWRYTVHEDEAWVVKLGATAKIRDAEIAVEQDGVSSSKTDVGLVPLFHSYAERRLGQRSRLILDLDALAAPQGRAVDFSAQVSFDVGRSLNLAGGWRVVDGGADNETVYNFARFNYATVSAMWRF
jgi:hypothetical protein